MWGVSVEGECGVLVGGWCRLWVCGVVGVCVLGGVSGRCGRLVRGLGVLL